VGLGDPAGDVVGVCGWRLVTPARRYSGWASSASGPAGRPRCPVWPRS